jgi:hypothetical protein
MDDVAGSDSSYGEIALVLTNSKLRLRVCRSAAGYFIGTFRSDLAVPISRESNEYYRTFDEAQTALEEGTWTQNKLVF